MKTNQLTVFLIALLFSVITQSVKAEVKLPAIVSSNMVLQRDATIQIWGWADANETFSFEASWLSNKLDVKANDSGNWSVQVKTTNSKSPQTITIKNKASNIVLSNILFGEVWLCSGQSNMFQSLKGYTGQPTFGGAKAILHVNNPNLRVFTVHKTGSKTPLNDVRGFSGWQEASPETVADFSAVAYFFGEELQEILDVPVGLIHSSWGGSTIEAWMSTSIIEKFKKEAPNKIVTSKHVQRSPVLLFNAMINPIIPYKIKGVLWYQGEANRQDPDFYKRLFPAMVKDWRERWGDYNFPIYYAQIAPYIYKGDEFYKTKEDNTANMRQAQLECLDLIPNSGIAITTDIGEEHSIHPPRKKEVAERLLFNALHKTYGFTSIEFEAPVYDAFEIKDGGILIKFKNAKSGLFSKGLLSNFEIAGADKVFYPCEAKIIRGKGVFVKSDYVIEPKAARYAWKNWVRGTLYGGNMLPVSSFRTDTWNESTRSKKYTN